MKKKWKIIKKVYLEHLRENGVLGNLKLAIKKEAIVWGIGTHGYTQYTKNVVEKTTCYDWLVGKKSGLFRTYMQAYNIVLYVLILSGVCCTFRKKKTDKYSWILQSTGVVRLSFIFSGRRIRDSQ